MRRIVSFLFTIVVYFLFCFTVLYVIWFMGNLQIANSIDARPQMPLVPALLIDISLVFLVFVLKRVRNSETVKYWMLKSLSPATLKKTDRLFASIFFLLLMWQWEPIGREVWEISHANSKIILTVFYLLGWALSLTTSILQHQNNTAGALKPTFLLRLNLKKSSVRIPIAHRYLRHGFFLGILMIGRSTPVMTVSHLFIAMLSTLYIIENIQLDERTQMIERRIANRFIK